MTAILDMSQAQAWIIVIGALATAVVSIIGAIKSRQNGVKLDEIHVLTNSQLTALKSDLATALKDIARLQKFISEGKSDPPDTPPVIQS